MRTDHEPAQRPLATPDFAAAGGPPPGTHLCWTYGDETAHDTSFLGYVTGGLDRGQQVLCFVPTATVDHTIKLIRDEIVDAETAFAAGHLAVSSAEEGYAPGGVFDPSARIAAFSDLADAAVADGYPAVRVFGDPTPVLEDPDVREQWPGYEVRVDLLLARKPLIGLCAFDVRHCAPSTMHAIDALHRDRRGFFAQDAPFSLHADGTGGLCLSGEIDFGSADLLERAASDAIVDLEEPHVDVTEMRFADVAAVRALERTLRAIADRHGRAAVRGAGRSFLRMWELLGCSGSGIEVVPA